MTGDIDLTATDGQEVVSEVVTDENALVESEGQTDGQAAGTEKADTAEQAEKKSEAAKRREREKAHKEHLRSQAAEALARAEKAEAQRQKLMRAGEGENMPTAADFPDPTELAAAKAVWYVERRARENSVAELDAEAADARKQADVVAEAERQIVEKSWLESISEAKSRYADFEAVALNDEVPINANVAALIKSSESAADVAYWLGKNRDVAAQICALSPVEAARAIGRIEASIATPRPRTSTTAPAPIAPVKGGNSGPSKDPSKMTFAEFKKYRESGGKL